MALPVFSFEDKTLAIIFRILKADTETLKLL